MHILLIFIAFVYLLPYDCFYTKEKIVEEKKLTVRQAAEQAGVHSATIRRWIRTGALEATALPKRPGQRYTSFRLEPNAIDAAMKRAAEQDS